MCRSIVAVFAIALIAGSAMSQSSDRRYRKTGIMNGNQVRTVFGNWGVIGQPAEQGKRGAWKNDNNGYLGDVSPLLGAEVNWNGATFHSVVTPPVGRPTRARDEDPGTGKPWTLEPVTGYFNPNQEKVALSNDRNSWPTTPGWPDKLADQSDPGWVENWNGYFGKRISADLETYFVMDDNNDERFNVASNNIVNGSGVSFKPDSTNPSRNGLGLEVRVRAMQWAQFLAKDNIFWLYEITNTGTTDYGKAVFGMLVGTYVGVTSTEDYQEYADDWSFFDVNTNITYTGDYGNSTNNPLWVGPLGLVGYAFLESPGNPFDGIDNDGDADSVGGSISFPKFTSSSFDTTTIAAGMQIVLIDDQYARSVLTVPAVDSLLVTTRGLTQYIKPNITRVAEGNILKDSVGNEYVNPNALDGVDNDYDGLIDENYFLHYRQVKRTRTVPVQVLFDKLRPVGYTNYVTGSGQGPTTMIDERRDDNVDNNQDWDLTKDDVGRDGVRNTSDQGEGDGVPTSGYELDGTDTGLPGEPHIDKTDVRESDQIGLSSFFYFTPANNFSYADDEEMWRSLRPGYFDVPDNILNNRPVAGVDGDFFYGSGYFPLRAGSTERFSLALVYGGGRGGSVQDDIDDLLRNKKTVQKIYDANYQFPQPPEKPTVRAVPGDRTVTLYWDRTAEESIDPVLQIKDFEGYKIYKSTDPNFSDIFTITDGNGTPQGYRPLAQFDLKNSIRGFFTPSPELYSDAAGYAYYLGSDNGLQHTFTDTDVENGRTYFYAVVAYDRGSQIEEIFPSENSKFVSILPSGEVFTDVNVTSAVPNGKVAGYVEAPSGELIDHITVYGTGTVRMMVVDPSKVLPNDYTVEFLDWENDGLDNNNNGLVDAADSTEGIQRTSSYSVLDGHVYKELFSSRDTALVQLSRKNLRGSSIVIRDASDAIVPASTYLVDTTLGSIRGSGPGSFPAGSYAVEYRYYPVYRSSNINIGEGVVSGLPEVKDSDIFDGLQLVFSNNWTVRLNDSRTRWVGPDAYRFSMAPMFEQITIPPPPKIFRGVGRPGDYDIEFYDTIVDTSIEDNARFAAAIPVSFKVRNVTDGTYIDFTFADNDANQKLSPIDELAFIEKGPAGNAHYTWVIQFVSKLNDPPDTTYVFRSGDKLELRMDKPFRKGDVFEFTPALPATSDSSAQASLSRIRVVPNPYVSASEFEPPLNPGITSGRGTRKIDFTRLPAGAVIHIYTARGEHVQSLRHDGNIEDGTISWNLKTKENLDVAFGVYFYVVDSPSGRTTGKFAIIK